MYLKLLLESISKDSQNTNHFKGTTNKTSESLAIDFRYLKSLFAFDSWKSSSIFGRHSSPEVILSDHTRVKSVNGKQHYSNGNGTRPSPQDHGVRLRSYSLTQEIRTLSANMELNLKIKKDRMYETCETAVIIKFKSLSQLLDWTSL